MQALLDSHGIESVRTSGLPAALFPFTVNPMGETRVSVREEDAEEAVRIIESHREQVGGGLVVPLPQQFAALETRLGYRFRDRGLLEHALTHKSKAHEDPSGGVIDNESLEFLGDAVLGLVIADALFRTFPEFSEGQKSKIKAMVVSTAALAELAERLRARRAHDSRARRREDRRAAQAGAAGRHVRGADRGDLSRRRPRAGAPVHPARAGRRRSKRRASPTTSGRDHKSRLQEALQALGRPLPIYRVAGEVGPGPPQDVSRRSARRRRSDRAGRGPDEEGRRAGSREGGAAGLASEGNAASWNP